VNVIQGFKMATKSILTNKVRSLLTMLGIIIGIAAVMTLVSVVQAQTNELKSYYESIGSNQVSVYAYKWNGKDVSEDLYDFCLGLDEYVEGVTPNMQIWSQNGIKYRTTTTKNHPTYYDPQIYLGSDQFALCNNFQIETGRDISFLDIKTYNQVVVIGAAMAEYLFQYKNPIGEKITISGHTFEVIGVYKAKDTGMNEYWNLDYMAVLPYSMNRIMNNSNTLGDFTIKAKSSDKIQPVIDKLNTFLGEIITDSNGYFYVYSNQQYMDQADEQQRMTSYVLGGIAGISLLVGGIGIMNIMLVTVRERTREIGIRKAIGGSRRTILTQFLIEASVVCFLGGILGIILGFLATVVAGKIITDSLVFPNAFMTLGAAAFSIVLGIVFGMYPAIKASGLQPVDALRAD